MDLAGKSTNVFLEFKPNEEANNGGATPGCICPGRNTTALAAKSVAASRVTLTPWTWGVPQPLKRKDLHVTREPGDGHWGVSQPLGGKNELCPCPAVFSPVCTTAKRTWANECVAKCRGEKVLRQGICEGDENWLPRKPATPDPKCKCSKSDDPVCGSDGVTYANEQCARTCGNIVKFLKGSCAEVCPCDAGYDPVCDDSTQTQYLNACFASYCMNVDNNVLYSPPDRHHCNWSAKKTGKNLPTTKTPRHETKGTNLPTTKTPRHETKANR